AAERRLVLRQRRGLQPDAAGAGRGAARGQARRGLERGAGGRDRVEPRLPAAHAPRRQRARAAAAVRAPRRTARRGVPAAGNGMTLVKLSRRAVAAEFLRRQWLDRPRGRRLTERTLADFVSATCGLQIDSVNVLDRAHHLTLWSRFGPY